jgi:adenylate cyclase
VNHRSDHTFLFADLAGFTALTEAHGDEEAVELLQEFCGLVRTLLPDHAGHEVKTIGDAMMIRVDDARKAVELGLRIAEGVGATPGFPVVRVGMHTGTAIERDGDWFGATVNLAARISAAAGGGEVLISEATAQAAGSVPGVELSRHGYSTFKNVREPVALHRVIRQGGEDSGLPVDPVCRMAVDPDHAAGRLRHEGKLFSFCSLDCARRFAADPDRYTAERASPDPRGGTAVIPSPALILFLADTFDMHGEFGTGWWVVMMFGMLLFWGLLIGAIVWVARELMHGRRARAVMETPGALLDRRFAAGEISAEEYRERKALLAGTSEDPGKPRA